MFRLRTDKPHRVLWVGKKSIQWANTRARLKRKFAAMGIVTCELGYLDCWVDNALSFAHGKKRRHLRGDELETLCILACTPCHQKLERMPEVAMGAIVQSVIAERNL